PPGRGAHRAGRAAPGSRRPCGGPEAMKTMKLTKIRAALAAVAAALCLWAAPAAALAQEVQKVERPMADEIPAVPFVGIAYGFIWIAVLGYVLVLGKNLGRVKGEVDELRRKIEGQAGGAAAGGAREAQRK